MLLTSLTVTVMKHPSWANPSQRGSRPEPHPIPRPGTSGAGLFLNSRPTCHTGLEGSAPCSR